MVNNTFTFYQLDARETGLTLQQCLDLGTQASRLVAIAIALVRLDSRGE